MRQLSYVTPTNNMLWHGGVFHAGIPPWGPAYEHTGHGMSKSIARLFANQITNHRNSAYTYIRLWVNAVIASEGVSVVR